MTWVHPCSARQFLLGFAALAFGFLTAGCDEVGKRYPVTGRVTRNGAPIEGKTGSVVFKPDRDRGNRGTFEAVGKIDATGNFVLSSKGKAGAPLGWYKVVVIVSEPGQSRIQNRTATDRKPKAAPIIPARFANEATSGLVKEVVAQPGAGSYDLDLTP